jgi:hypothetical protein
MNATARVTPPRLLVAALGLGLATDGLVRAPLWGFNVTLLVTMLTAWGIDAQRLSGDRPGPRMLWPWLGACVFAAMWALRAEEALLAANLLAVIGLLSLPVLGARGVSMAVAGVLDVVRAPLLAAWESVVGGVRALLRDVPWGPVLGPRRSLVLSTLAGLVIAVPVMLVFGSLFASADPAFNAAAQVLVDWELGTAAGHVALATAGTWLSAGYLRGLATSERRPLTALPTVRLGLPAVAIALGAMVLVFTLFVAVQAGNLFRGEAWVREHVGLTFAEYARDGFFQLVVASALALPLVYGATFLAGTVAEAETRSIRALQGVALALVAAVALSALWRLGLYVGAYGLTEDRIYGAAVILGIAGTIAVLGRTILVGRTAGVARGVLVTAAAVLGLLNAVSPAALTARVNLAGAGTREVDYAYIGNLGADAVPVVADRLASLDPAGQCTVARRLVERWRRDSAGDWRGWNIARTRASERMPEVERIAAACPPTPAPAGPAS